MKLTTVLILFAVLMAKASTIYSQNIHFNLNLKNATIVDIFREIELKTDFGFFFRSQDMNLEKLQSIDISNATIEDVLKVVLDENYSYKILDKNIVITKGTLDSNLQQMRHKVSGKVTDQSGKQLPGVSVVIKGTTIGTATDNDGNYSLTNLPENSILQFLFIGMTSQEIAVTNKTSIDVEMHEKTIGLDEIVTIGYGTRSKRDVTTSISTISTDKILKVVASSPELLMQGQMSGVQVVGNAGSPSARPTVRIRGTNTFGIADPLYVIDGIPIKEWGAGVENDPSSRGNLNIMQMIDPNDIESISVLKDASAAAIYGLRASNGVILITTKSGKSGKTTVNYSQRLGIQNLTKKIDLLDAKQYVDFTNAYYNSDPTSAGSRNPENSVFNPTDPNYLGNMATQDWQSAIKNKNAITTDNNVSVSGRTDKTDYYISFGYANQEGVLIDDNLKRYSGSIKFNEKINDFLKVGINYRISTAKGRNLNYYTESLLNVAKTPVVQPIYDSQGVGGYAQVVKGYDQNGVWDGTYLYGSGTLNNLPGFFSQNFEMNSSLRNMGSVYVEFQPLKGLKFKGTLSIDQFDNTEKGGYLYNGTYFYRGGGDPNAIPGSVANYAIRGVKNLNKVKEFTANYTKSFGDHNVDILISALNQKTEADWSDVGTSYETSSNINIINLGGANTYLSESAFSVPGALVGFLFRGDYNYSSKYYLDFTIRRDGSARFAPENRWGTFPAMSLAWRISKENFMKDVSAVNDLKFRAGYGQLGNQEVADLAYLSLINTSPTYAWGNNPAPRTSDPNSIGLGYTSPGAAVYGMANRDLRWETTTTLNVGFDAVLLNNSVNLSMDYYNKLTDGILQRVNLPQSTGIISMPSGNIAAVRNSGIELNINYKHSFGDFNLSIGGNLTTVKNRVEKLYGGIPMSNIEVGQSLFFIRGYKVAGIFQTDQEAQNWMGKYSDQLYQAPKVGAGDFYFKDINGAPKAQDIAKGINKFYSPQPDGIIDSYDEVNIGKTIPGFYYGFNINADYKGIDFTAQFTGVGDVQKADYLKATFGLPYGEAQNHTLDVLNAWTPTNTNTNIPRMIYQDPANNERISDYFVENAGYLRLANIQMGYTLPKVVYTSIKGILQNVRIYIGCSNLFTITKFKGLDPEDEFNPAPLIVYTGLNVSF